nr:reverse transcriptase domain-containing protein [Tanacetum cinerariifolium]
MTTTVMVKSVEETYVICGGAHPYYDCIATDSNFSSVCATTGTYNQGSTGFRPQVATNYRASPPSFPPVQNNQNRSGSLPSNTVPNPRADLKAITSQSGVTLAGPSISSKNVDREAETITDQVLIENTNNVPPLVFQPSLVSTSFSTISSFKIPEVTKDTVQLSTENIQPSVAQTQIPIDEPVVALKPKPTILYPSRANKQKLYALLHMPKFSLMFKSLLINKEKLFDLATTLVNENCSVVILKKLTEKLRDPDKFLIPCDFPKLDECLALADLGASIKLMPLSIWRKLSLPELTSTPMILELADRSTTRPSGIAEDVRDGWKTRALRSARGLGTVLLGSEPEPKKEAMLERLAGNEFYCFLDGFSGYFQIIIDPQDQEKTNFTCPYGTFAYRRMPFGLCNAPGTFQWCMMKLTDAPILVVPDWNLPFELMCDASDFAIGVVLEQLSKMLSRDCSGGFSSYKNLISLSVAPPEAIMVPISPLRKYLMPASFGELFTEMHMTRNRNPYPFPSSRLILSFDLIFHISPRWETTRDSDSFMEEIDLSFTPNDPMPSGIEEDDYDSEEDITILEELFSNDSLSLPENESFHFDISSSSRPLAKPPDGNSRILNVKVMGDISEHKVPMPRLMLTQPTLVPN